MGHVSRRAVLAGAVITTGLGRVAIAQAVPLKVGLMMPFSGTYAALGENIAAGFELLIAENGGALGGRPVTLVRLDDESDPAKAPANVNRLVYEASSSNRYATFFYGQYDPTLGKFDYVNAGHNPPMLFHCSSGKWTVSRLETSGTVVGLLESFPYQQAAVTIAQGDIFVAFTDGISEAMNNADEEWGEERLQDTMQACMGLNPADTIRSIMQAADAFVAGAKQHDDMTLVVLRAQA